MINHPELRKMLNRIALDAYAGGVAATKGNPETSMNYDGVWVSADETTEFADYISNLVVKTISKLEAMKAEGITVVTNKTYTLEDLLLPATKITARNDLREEISAELVASLITLSGN